MSPTIRILTPLYDPSGQALELFRICGDSVLRQRASGWKWIISVQDLSPDYEPVMLDLKRDPRIRVVDGSAAKSLSEHLDFLLLFQSDGVNHILCQDDCYTSDKSLSTIARVVADHHFVILSPVHLVADVSHGNTTALQESDDACGNRLQDLTSAQQVFESVGINLLGGLSSIAWSGHRELPSMQTNLYADIELRLRLSESLGVPTWGSLELVGEHIWPGQAQKSIDLRGKGEVRTWCTWRNQEGVDPLGALRICISQGDFRLARGWYEVLSKRSRMSVSTLLTVVSGVLSLAFSRRIYRRAVRRIRARRFAGELART